MSVKSTSELNVRIIELPSVPMARSGKSDLEAFAHWALETKHEEIPGLFPRDFMWFNAVLDCFEWLWALPPGMTDTNGYEVFQFPGGLYAVAVCKDGPEILETNRLIHEWVRESEYFAEDFGGERYDMGHMVTPRNAKELMGFEQMDLFIPIVPKAG